MNDSGNAQSWWYNAEGKQLGPVTGDELIGLIKARKITEQTVVWQEGQDTWKPAAQTALSELITTHGPALPPAMPKGPPPMPTEPNMFEKVWLDIQGRDRFAWAVIPVLALSILIELVTGWTLFSVIFAIVGNITCLVLDTKRLKKLDLPRPGEIWCLVVPVYLWKRGGLLKDMRFYLAAWMLLFCGNIYMTYAAIQRQMIVDTATELVEKVINRGNYMFHAGNGPKWKVKSIKIIRKIGPDEYKAIAISTENQVYEVDIQQINDEIMVSVRARD